MKLTRLAIATAASFALAAPVLAQSSPHGSSMNMDMGGSDMGGSQQGRAARMSIHDRDTVMHVQQSLKDKGYDVGAVDGVWGGKSRAALREYQRAQGMQASGEIDQQTLAGLGIQAQNVGQSPPSGSRSTGSTGSTDNSGRSNPSSGAITGPGASGPASGAMGTNSTSQGTSGGTVGSPGTGTAGSGGTGGGNSSMQPSGTSGAAGASSPSGGASSSGSTGTSGNAGTSSPGGGTTGSR